jgi:CubicO group peptidase (beta-lactamase class C family)
MACSFGCAALAAEPTIWPAQSWVVAAPAEMGMDSAHLEAARQYALTGAGSGIITRHGRCVLQWGDQQQRYDLKSTTKSFGATALGLAIADNKMQLTDAAIQFLPSLGLPPDKNGETGWLPEIKIWHLATQTAGFAKPGGCEPLLFRPGTEWHYSDGGPNWLADCLTKTYRQDLSTLMFRRVFTPIGITKQDLSWRRNAYRDRKLDGIERREFGSGISANVNAMARLGYLYLRNGRWKDKSILPASYVDQVRTPYPPVIGLPEHAALHGNASDHYGLLWWNNADGTLPHVPRDAYWSWGLYDSVILVVPSLDMVVARAGRSWKRAEGERHYDVLAPFFNAIVESVQSKNAVHAPPYPPSPVIAGIRWAPADSIERQACGSDNWPMTWADDDQLYTAYGDGFGFEPPVDQKLSLGFARVTGMPPEFSGHNIRSPSGERKGDGKTGIKASGLLMVDGVLYMWVRNASNAQLAWSHDRARTWQWSSWKLTTSFGCPTFLNFGRDYSGARDNFVYVYSPDVEDAYSAANQMVLARVPKTRLRQRESYEFFAGLDPDNQPIWAEEIGKRQPVFEHAGNCYRSGITYNAGLQRYLWCQVLPPQKGSRGPRFAGGFGLYDAPEPWGPWSTVFFTRRWDVGPGETSSLPTKWISREGRNVYLVFSGEDCFSVREGILSVR